MTYESLQKIYYKDNSKWEEEYNNRFNAPFTEHFDFNIKHHGYNEAYPAFYCITPEILKLLDKIHTLHITLNHQARYLPPIAAHKIVQSYIIQEIQSSNEIEGVISSKKEIRDALKSFNLTNKARHLRFSSVIEKYNELAKRKRIHLETCQDIRNLYDEFILNEVISANLNNKPDGAIFRADNVEITTGTQKLLHMGTYPESKLIKEMEKALEILHNENLPPLIRIAIFHYLFGYIHPFYDGNGRTIRFITSYFISIYFPPLVALNISLLINRNQKLYSDMFEKTTSCFNRGDLSFFITGFLYIIENAFDDVITNLKKQLETLTLYREKIHKLQLTDLTTYALYEILLQATIFSDEGLTMQDMINSLDKSINTIKNRLNAIPDKHLIVDTSEKIHRYKLNLRTII